MTAFSIFFHNFLRVIFLCSDGKETACNAENLGSIPGLGRSPGEGGAWQPTPVFLAGEFHGQRSLVGCSPHGCRVGHDWVTNTRGSSTPRGEEGLWGVAGFLWGVHCLSGRLTSRSDLKMKTMPPWGVSDAGRFCLIRTTVSLRGVISIRISTGSSKAKLHLRAENGGLLGFCLEPAASDSGAGVLTWLLSRDPTPSPQWVWAMFAQHIEQSGGIIAFGPDSLMYKLKWNGVFPAISINKDVSH